MAICHLHTSKMCCELLQLQCYATPVGAVKSMVI
uniref:Uncharacterized protein n=1 Tax=Anguilla anguilla TaxID=7936 RepID=A0A0E9SSQ2_ANGAN